jgi:hypothetical protein
VPPSCQQVNGVGDGVRLGGTAVVTISVVGLLVGDMVTVDVGLIVADGVGEGVAEAGEVAVGMVFVSLSTGVNGASVILLGEVCGLHATSTSVMIRIRKVVQVRINKSPLLLWLALPLGSPVYQKYAWVV